MQCVKCGYIKRGSEAGFICDDCQRFSVVIDKLWDEVNGVFKELEVINPETDPVLKFLSDSSFITHDNPQTRIFYKISSLIINKAWNHDDTITELELNRSVSTTRGWRDVLEIFEELDIIEVKTEKYQRILKIKDKAQKVASAWRSLESIDKQIINRTALIFSGYVLLYILYKMNKMRDIEDISQMPYRRRPRTLWVSLMILWSKPYNGEKSINEDEITKFLGRRGIPSGTTLKIKQSLHNMTKDTTGMIQDVSLDKDGNRIYKYSDYVTIELERIREGRTRERVE